MSLNAELHLAYKVANAPINMFPYPHFFVRDVFPQDFYQQIQENLPDPAVLVPIGKARPVTGYKERYVLELKDKKLTILPEPQRVFWGDLASWLVGGKFATLMVDKFRRFLEERFKNGPEMDVFDEAMLVQDVTNYELGPHTDAPRKLITLLFYLPRDHSQSHLGTSIYLPKQRGARCPGGPHYPFDHFDCVYTMPFVPNSLFVFLKTDLSFHGVPPVGDPDTRRWLLLYDIYANKSPGAETKEAP